MECSYPIELGDLVHRSTSFFARSLRTVTVLLTAAACVALAAPAGRADGGDAGAPSASESRFALRFKAPHVPGELVVKLRDASSLSASKAIAALDLHVEERNVAVPSLLRLAGGGDDATAVRAAAELSANPDVAYVEPNYLFFEQSAPNDPQYRNQWGLRNSSGIDIGAEQAWDRTTGSDDVVVGVIDSGMDIRHKDLRDNLYHNPNEIPDNGVDDDHNGYVDDVNGWDAVTDTGTIKDEDSHGTHVSGTVGARGNNSEGVVGVNWRVKLLPLRFIKVHDGSLFDAIQCIDYAVKLRTSGVNLRVLNNSWGGGPFVSSLDDAIRRANAAGILFVCAAGNDSSDNDALPSYPASYESPNVISVGAMTKADFQAGFSNFGKRSVDIFAPGEDILSTLPNDNYGTFSGTSQASPHVAGIAALVAAARPDASVAEMKARVLGSSVADRFATNACLTGGRASAANALRTESTPPGALSDFRLQTVSRSTIVVAWTSVGDDGSDGTATYYDVRWSTSQITAASFDTAAQLSDSRMPLRPGQAETAIVRGCFPADAPVFVAMRVYDKAGNYSQSATLTAEPTGAIERFAVAPGPAASFDLGTPLDLKGDDLVKSVDLAFDFPYYGASYRTVYVSTNGLVTFDGPVATPFGSRADLAGLSAIAPLWYDLTTKGSLVPSEDVYLDANAASATFRWVAEPFFDPASTPTDLQPVTFAVTLHADGKIDVAYGPGGNRGLRSGGSLPVVGTSDGGCAVGILDAYTGVDSLASAPSFTLDPTPRDADGAPSLSVSPPTAREGLPSQFVVAATVSGGGPVALSAALPRNATFDAASGVVRFTPDSTQEGPVQFVFTATASSGASATKSVVVNVVDDGNLPEVRFIQVKKKITFNGIGFRIGARVEVDGSDVGDAKGSKKAPSSKITSANARAPLSTPGAHTVVVVNPDGTRSGPFFTFR
jgi:subtilisin family serine protease